MKIGYPCINLSIGCKADRTFRLRSYSEERLAKTVENNLNCLSEILVYNVKHRLLFFRITSDLIPFASHPICKFDWQKRFGKALKEIGGFIKSHNMRISMHPDQFTLINSLDLKVFENSVKELIYHAEVLDLMELDANAKIQLHVGGVYGDKEKSMTRFIERFEKLEEAVKKRLAVENDDLNYNLQDCLKISAETGVPTLFDTLHHEVNSSGETTKEAFRLFTGTWKKKDGLPMVDYSSHRTKESKRKHAEKIDLKHFKQFLQETNPFDFDVMLEIKDKEKSALKAARIASKDSRYKNAS
ncbi:MAG: UV DNA damage repair endonuclease UvsE [Candidatus Bathycorpusculaceae bacterium]